MRVLGIGTVLAMIGTGSSAFAADAYPSVEVLAATTTITGEVLHYPTTGPAPNSCRPAGPYHSTVGA